MNYGFCRRPWLNNTQSREVKKDMSTSGLYMHVHTCAGTPVPIHMHPHPCKRTHTHTTHIRTATVKVHASHRYCQLSSCVYNSVLANSKHIILSPYSLVLDVVNFILVSLVDFSLHFSVLWGIGFFLHLVGKHWRGFPPSLPRLLFSRQELEQQRQPAWRIWVLVAFVCCVDLNPSKRWISSKCHLKRLRMRRKEWRCTCGLARAVWFPQLSAALTLWVHDLAVPYALQSV